MTSMCDNEDRDYRNATNKCDEDLNSVSSSWNGEQRQISLNSGCVKRFKSKYQENCSTSSDIEAADLSSERNPISEKIKSSSTSDENNIVINARKIHELVNSDANILSEIQTSSSRVVLCVDQNTRCNDSADYRPEYSEAHATIDNSCENKDIAESSETISVADQPNNNLSYLNIPLENIFKTINYGPYVESGRKVASLQNLCIKTSLTVLGTKVWNWREISEGKSKPSNKKEFIRTYRTVVPGHVRRLLQERVLSQWRVWDTTTLRLLELLLSIDSCSSIRVRDIRSFFRDDFLRLLQPLHNLTVLTIQQYGWQTSSNQEASLCITLRGMPHLRVLALHYLATDAMLSTAVQHCKQLQIIDVFCSELVSSRSIGQLLGANVLQSRSQSRLRSSCGALPKCVGHLCRRVAAATVNMTRKGRRRQRTSIVSASESNHLGNAYMHQKNTILPCTEQILTTEDYENERQQRLSTKVLPKLRLLDLRGTSITPEYASLIAAVFPDVEVMRFQSKLSSEHRDSSTGTDDAGVRHILLIK